MPSKFVTVNATASTCRTRCFQGGSVSYGLIMRYLSLRNALHDAATGDKMVLIGSGTLGFVTRAVVNGKYGLGVVISVSIF